MRDEPSLLMTQDMLHHSHASDGTARGDGTVVQHGSRAEDTFSPTNDAMFMQFL